MKACSLTITKPRYVDIILLGKFDATVGRQNPQMASFVRSQTISFSLLNFCFEKRSSSLQRLKYFSVSHFFRKSITNFSSHVNISHTFFAQTAWAQSLNCLAVIESKYGSISSNIKGRMKCDHKWIGN